MSGICLQYFFAIKIYFNKGLIWQRMKNKTSGTIYFSHKNGILIYASDLISIFRHFYSLQVAELNFCLDNLSSHAFIYTSAQPIRSYEVKLDLSFEGK
jgi:hypothetical protein